MSLPKGRHSKGGDTNPESPADSIEMNYILDSKEWCSLRYAIWPWLD